MTFLLQHQRDAFRRALRPFKGPDTGVGSCEIRRAPTWLASDDNQVVACHYEQTPPKAGAPHEYESGDGYGYTVWFDVPVTISEEDLVLVNGITIQVQVVPPTGNLTPVQRIEGVMRGG